LIYQTSLTRRLGIRQNRAKITHLFTIKESFDMDLDILNTLQEEQFLVTIGGPLEGETWLAARVITHRPFADRDALIKAFKHEIDIASVDEKIRLLNSHQAAAGLNRLTPQEYDEFKTQNQAYRQTFGFAFVICARENTKHSILAAFRERLTHPRDDEILLSVNEVFKILRLRLIDLIT
jgi:2-oxo-4-hydroxy-4-carboxy--5-ureidoimidazoline (OHCU) decarboxylase